IFISTGARSRSLIAGSRHGEIWRSDTDRGSDDRIHALTKATVPIRRQGGQGRQMLIIGKTGTDPPSLRQAAADQDSLAERCDRGTEESDRLLHPSPAPAARGGAGMIAAFQDRRDERFDRVDLAGIEEGAQDPATALDQDIGHAAPPELFE